MNAHDICTTHNASRCATDLRLYGFADHCEAPFGGGCGFGDGTGTGEQLEDEEEAQ